MQPPNNVQVLSDRQALSLQDVTNACKTVADMHQFALRAGYRVPALNSKMCTPQYLHAVRARQVFCHMSADIRVKNCPMPPAPKVLLQLLMQAA